MLGTWLVISGVCFSVLLHRNVVGIPLGRGSLSLTEALVLTRSGSESARDSRNDARGSIVGGHASTRCWHGGIGK